MSITPFVKSPKEFLDYNYGNFKRDIIRSARKLAKNHFSPETAAPFYLNLDEDGTIKRNNKTLIKDAIDGISTALRNKKNDKFFIIFGKIQRWKDYAKAVTNNPGELALRGYCFVTMENDTLILNLMGVKGKLRSKPNDIRKAGAKAISKAKLRFELIKGDFDENENLENRAESLPEVEDSGEDIDDSDLEGDASEADDAVAAADNETTTANPQIEQAAKKALDAIRQAFNLIQNTTDLETYAVQTNNIKEAYKSWTALHQKSPRPASEQTSINETMAAVKVRANELRIIKLENLIEKYEALADKPDQAETLKLQQQTESLIEVLDKAGIAALQPLITRYANAKVKVQETLASAGVKTSAAPAQEDFFDVIEKDAKLQKAVEIVKKADKSKIEAAAKALVSLQQYTKASAGNLTVAQSAELSAQANASASAELKGIMQGIQVLIDAGVVAKGSFDLKGEYKNKYADLQASLQALARIEASIKGDIKLFSLATLTLIDAKFEATAVAKAEATAQAKGKVEILDIANVTATGTATAYARAEATATGTLKITKDGIVAAGKLVALAEVGAKAKGEISLNSKSNKPLIKLTGEAGASAGVGVELGGSFRFEKGKIYLRVDVGAAAKAGGNAAGAIEINYDAIAEVLINSALHEMEKVQKKGKDYAEKVKAKAKQKTDAARVYITQVEKASQKVLGNVNGSIQKNIDETSQKAQKVLQDIATEANNWVNDTKTAVSDLQTTARRSFDALDAAVTAKSNELSAEAKAKYDSFKKKFLSTFSW